MTTADTTIKHFELAVGLATEALKALLFVNGGAAAALVALTDRTGSKHDYSQSIITFGIGALVTVASLMFGYFSQLAHANSRYAADYLDEPGRKRHQKWHVTLNTVAFVLAVLALAAGGWGMFTAFAEARRVAN